MSSIYSAALDIFRILRIILCAAAIFFPLYTRYHPRKTMRCLRYISIGVCAYYVVYALFSTLYHVTNLCLDLTDYRLDFIPNMLFLLSTTLLGLASTLYPLVTTLRNKSTYLPVLFLCAPAIHAVFRILSCWNGDYVALPSHHRQCLLPGVLSNALFFLLLIFYMLRILIFPRNRLWTWIFVIAVPVVLITCAVLSMIGSYQINIFWGMDPYISTLTLTLYRTYIMPTYTEITLCLLFGMTLSDFFRQKFYG